MKCCYYEQKKCLSCRWIERSYPSQLQEKQQYMINQLSQFSPKQIFQPIASKESRFRNKAKMAVLGTVEKPILGILTNNQPIDLCDCPLYSEAMKIVLHKVKVFIKKLQLVPYNITKKKGELKFIIISEAENQFMLRFVLRSNKYQLKIANAVDELKATITGLAVITVNIQPQHAAILEGKDEVILTQQKYLPAKLNHIPLFLLKGSFFQTNTSVAAQLYATARNWLTNLPIHSVWDLFCGVGGFGLHCVTPERKLVGIEINHEAIECAKLSANLLGYSQLHFQSLDASQFALSQKSHIPDLILVNPPRRGIGNVLINYLQTVSPNYILYSSCNLISLVADLKALADYQIHCAQLFDMFPHSEHMEVLVLLHKNNKEN